jgi:hypothetical protein
MAVGEKMRDNEVLHYHKVHVHHHENVTRISLYSFECTLSDSLSQLIDRSVESERLCCFVFLKFDMPFSTTENNQNNYDAG